MIQKEVDVWFILHNGLLWHHSAFEPLIAGISFPLLSPSSPYPWQVKQERKRVVDLGRTLSQMSKLGDLRVGDYLHQLSRRGHFPVCNGSWCATCFTSHPLDRFEIKMPRDFNGASLSEVDDEIRFRQARPGDHLCVPFQCPNCQSQNIRGRLIDPTYIDDLVLECMLI